MKITKTDSTLLIASLLICLTACVKEISLQNGTDRQLPVMNGIFSVGGYPSVFRLTYTANPLSEQINTPEDAQVFFSQDGELVAEVSPDADGYCVIPDLFAQTGSVLSAMAVFPEGDTLTATDSIPTRSFVYNDGIYGSAGFVDEHGDNVNRLSVRFTDPPNQKNYYELFVFSWNDFSTTDSFYVKVLRVYQANTILSNEGDQDFQPWTMYFSDELFDGETVNFEQYFTGATPTIRMPGKPFGLEEDGTYLLFRNVSKAYYQSQKSWTRHRYTQRVGEGIADVSDAILEDFQRVIFAPEPTPMYSNVEGGLGVFAGINTQIIKLD